MGNALMVTNITNCSNNNDQEETIDRLSQNKAKRHKTTNEKIRMCQLILNGGLETTKHGNYTRTPTDTTLVKLGDSNIPNANRGVFANTQLMAQQILTKYEGELRENLPEDSLEKQYTIEIEQMKPNNHRVPGKHYLVGLREPKVGYGLGSFINHSDELQNCEFVVDSDRRTVWVVATKNINEGEELYVTYGKDFDYHVANIKNNN